MAVRCRHPSHPRSDKSGAPAGDLRGARPAAAVQATGDRAARHVAHVDTLLDEAGTTDPALPLLARLESIRSRWAERATLADDDPDATSPAEIAAALIGWAIPYLDLAAFREAIAARRAAIAELCRDDAPLSLATAHGTKGLEFDHVAVIGLDAGRFSSRRSVAEASDPGRALEEERRLAYVAWTRARRSLTLVYDPLAPSSFLLEAFSPEELGVDPAV